MSVVLTTYDKDIFTDKEIKEIYDEYGAEHINVFHCTEKVVVAFNIDKPIRVEPTNGANLFVISQETNSLIAYESCSNGENYYWGISKIRDIYSKGGFRLGSLAIKLLNEVVVNLDLDINDITEVGEILAIYVF